MKKHLALALALVLSLAVMVPGFAASDTETGEAGIEFEGRGTGIDPDPDPDGDGSKLYSVTGLDFGTHAVAETISDDPTDIFDYESEVWAGMMLDDNGNLVLANNGRETQKTTGLWVYNDNPDSPWTVKVSMNAFTIGTTPTMGGYTLDLNMDASQSRETGVAPTTVVANVNGIAGDGVEVLMLDAAQGEGLGEFGYVYGGELHVPANSVSGNGFAQATMTYTIEYVPYA